MQYSRGQLLVVSEIQTYYLLTHPPTGQVVQL